MIVALTGGTGFVGGHLINGLSEAGCHIRALQRRPGSLQQSDRLVPVTGDLDDAAALKQLLEGADAVLHLAGAITAPNRERYFTVNAQGTAHVIAAAQAADTPRFIHVSSLAAREASLSAYAASKQAAEEAVIAGGNEGLDWTILRPPAVYGPGDRATFPLIKQLTQRHCFIPGNKAARFSLIYVKDLAAALIKLVLDPGCQRQIVDIDDGKAGGYNWSEVMQFAGQVTGREPVLHLLPRNVLAIPAALCGVFSKMTGRNIMLSTDKLNELYHDNWVVGQKTLTQQTDWRPKYPFTRGFHETLSWAISKGWMRWPQHLTKLDFAGNRD